MTYPVLGSNSFAGANFVTHALDQAIPVVGVSRSVEPPPALLAYGQHRAISHFEFYQMDINQDPDRLFDLIHLKKPQVIVDFVGQGMVAESWQNPMQWYQTNIVAKVKLHDFLRHCDFLERYVRVSTPGVYGSTSQPVGEDQRFSPSTPYAVSHAAIDMSLLAFYRQYQFPVILTRFANFYGPYQQLYRIIPRTLLYALMGKRLPLHGGGHSKRAFIHGQDVAAAIQCVIEKGQCGETYHFSSGDVISIAALVQQICDLLEIDMASFVEISDERPGKDAMYVMDTEKAKQSLGWLPQVSLQQGLLETFDWVKKHFNQLKQYPLNYVHKI